MQTKSCVDAGRILLKGDNITLMQTTWVYCCRICCCKLTLCSVGVRIDALLHVQGTTSCIGTLTRADHIALNHGAISCLSCKTCMISGLSATTCFWSGNVQLQTVDIADDTGFGNFRSPKQKGKSLFDTQSTFHVSCPGWFVLLDLLLEAVHLSSSAASGCLSNMDFQIAVLNSHCGNQLLQNGVLYLAPCGLSSSLQLCLWSVLAGFVQCKSWFAIITFLTFTCLLLLQWLILHYGCPTGI